MTGHYEYYATRLQNAQLVGAKRGNPLLSCVGGRHDHHVSGVKNNKQGRKRERGPFGTIFLLQPGPPRGRVPQLPLSSTDGQEPSLSASLTLWMMSTSNQQHIRIASRHNTHQQPSLCAGVSALGDFGECALGALALGKRCTTDSTTKLH